jgi:hypothetical protein
MADDHVETSTEITQPVIIDLGKQTRRNITNLKKGEGKLWDEIFEVADEVKDMLGAEAEGKVLLPVVMLYEKKPSSRREDLRRILFPLLDDEDDDEDEEENDEE